MKLPKQYACVNCQRPMKRKDRMCAQCGSYGSMVFVYQCPVCDKGPIYGHMSFKKHMEPHTIRVEELLRAKPFGV